MTTVTAKIDISRPAGRRLVNELKKKQVVKLEQPLFVKSKKTYTLDEVFDKGEEIINKHFGSNLKMKDF